MKKQIILPLILIFSGATEARQSADFDYFSANRTMIRNGVQAVLMCNGLFTSGRTIEQVFKQELAYLSDPVGSLEGGDYVIERDLKAVAVGGNDSGQEIRAVFRDGIGCVVMAPDQGIDEIDSLPISQLPQPASDPATTPWPDGDVIEQKPLSPAIDPKALEAASNWAFDRETPQQDTLSLIVVHKGEIILERYADGIDMNTRTRTWSTAKSIASTLIGMLVDEGRLQLDAPLGIDWLPELANEEDDPRDEITLRHVLNMSSGLYPVDSFGMEYATGSGLSYWAGASSVDGARSRAQIREPGTTWDYENYDTLLAVYAMKLALGDANSYASFPRKALLDRIGMRNTLISTDRFGDFIFSSQVYTNARDLARFGLLYQQNGKWHDERLISEDWIAFETTPAPSTAEMGNMYGGQFWLVPDDRTDIPKTAYTTAGNRGQYVVIIPSHETVIVRRGLDYGKQGFDEWDLTREVLKAIEPGK